MPLSALAVRNAKPGPKPYKLSDAAGLYLLVQTSGSRLWRLDYRFQGVRKTLALGIFPVVELSIAREKALAARKLLDAGQDPSAVKKLVKIEAIQRSGNTFEVYATRWFDARKRSWVKGYAERVWARLKHDILPKIGAVPIDQVTPPMLLAAIRKIEDRGAVVLAKRVKGYCGEVFRFAIAEGVASTDPSAHLSSALKAAPPPKHRAALKARDLPDFLVHLNDYDGDVRTKLAIRMIMLTFVRTQELRFAEWSEFEGLKGKEPLWRIPGRKMKGKAEHIVPLAPQVLDLIEQIRALEEGSRFVFPSSVRGDVMSSNTLIFAMYRMGFHSRATVHGFRGLASTVLNESGLFPSDWIERQLAHVEGNEVRAAYNAAAYLADRRRMMIWWADYIGQQQEIADLLG